MVLSQEKNNKEKGGKGGKSLDFGNTYPDPATEIF